MSSMHLRRETTFSLLFCLSILRSNKTMFWHFIWKLFSLYFVWCESAITFLLHLFAKLAPSSFHPSSARNGCLFLNCRGTRKLQKRFNTNVNLCQFQYQCRVSVQACTATVGLTANIYIDILIIQNITVFFFLFFYAFIQQKLKSRTLICWGVFNNRAQQLRYQSALSNAHLNGMDWFEGKRVKKNTQSL